MLPRIDETARASFGGSNQLAQQARQGFPFDVFLSASPQYTQTLFAEGIVRKPVAFATNSLVLIVPRRNPARISSVADLAKRPKLRLVVAGPKVPIGLYTREVLKRLGLLRVLRKTVSLEPDVKGIVGKVALGEADAGFVYATDVRPVAGKVRVIRFPPERAADRRLRGGDRIEAARPGGRSGVPHRAPGAGGAKRASRRGVRAPAVNRAFGVVLWGAAVLTLAFLLVPIAAIFLRVPPGDLLDALGSPVARDALRVTVATTLTAQTVILVVGTPAAYLLATRRFRGRALAITLVELPLVLPPAVAGIALLAAFGRFGLLGETLSFFGLEVAFTRLAVVLAIVFVAGPFFLRTAIAAFEAVDGTLVDASRTLGAGPARTFARVALPLASGGLGAGAALAFARGLGEFGATIMFAGSLQGVTQTLSLAVYEQFDVDFDTALAIGAELVAASAALLLAVKLIPSWRSSTQSFPTPFARSTSS